MKIVSSHLEFSTQYLATQEKQTKESLEILNATGGTVSRQGDARDAAGSPVQISEAARQSLQMEQSRSASEVNRQTNNDPKLNLLRMAIEMLTGEKIELSDVEIRDPKDAGGGTIYRRDSSYTETEMSDFSAQGSVRTADGREINFQLSMSMFRAYHSEEHVEVRTGVALKDPLVLNFQGNAAELSDMTFRFDLDTDGHEDNMRALKPGSGFLVFDRNGDGRVNDGRELFGATTGDGFGELALLDDDGNGWIDENDSAWKSLYVWTKGANGQDSLRSLKEANVGAIALTYANTPFSLKDANNDLLGQIRSTGVFLKENGGVGTVQKIDIAV
ncbi:MAG: VCBS repeat-containing protein [Azoarcus sp.]|jgi:hypothetical protein|nr:VCBS repeat-containing protein [Azoarcus sp.]